MQIMGSLTKWCSFCRSFVADELSKAALRFRLYGCKKMRRHYIFAESIIAFPVFNLHGGEADIPVALESKVGHGSVVDSVGF